METDLSLVALTPGDMTPTQHALSGWCTRKVAALEAEFKELEEHQLIAQSNGWKLSALNAALNRTTKRIDYYRKMQIAVDEGYVLVPNFPAEIMAVRVREDRGPGQKVADYSYSGAFNATAAQLPAGEGRYVDDDLPVRDESTETVDANGKDTKARRFVADSYNEEIDMPFKGVKPAVLDAVGRAMALKVFDRISLVRNQGTDPIFVGELLDPRGNDRRCTFFLAWWLNTADL